MKFLPTLAAAAALALLPPLAAQADPRKSPSVDYSADVVATTDGKVAMNSKVWQSGARVRIEMTDNGESMAMILDRTKRQLLVLFIKRQTYQQEALPDGNDPLNPIASGTWDVKEAGKETINGVAATKWAVDGKSVDGQSFKGFVWTSKDNIQVKLEGESTEDGKKIRIGTELKNVKVGPVDASLFALPQGFKLAPKDKE